MKKKLFTLLMCTLAIAGLSACGSGNSSDGGTSSTSKVKLKYTGWGSPTEKKATQAVIDKFEKDHENIEVEYIHIPTDYATKLTTMIAANQTPDVAMVEPAYAIPWADQGKINNVLELSKDDADFDISNYSDNFVMYKDKDFVTGVISAGETYQMTYNAELLDKAGIEVPTKAEDAWTWDEFLENAQKLTVDRNGNNALSDKFDEKNIATYGCYIPSGHHMLSVVYAASGEKFVSEDGNSINIQGTKAEELIQKFADLINKYHVAPTPAASKNLPTDSQAILSNKAAMAICGQWVLLEMGESKKDFGVGVLPKFIDKSTTTTLGSPICSFAATKHPKEAWLLQKAFYDTAGMSDMYQNGLWMPAEMSWYDDPELLSSWAEGNPAHPDGYIDAVAEQSLHNAVPSLENTVKNLPNIMNVLSPALDKVWLGEETVAEAIPKIQEKLDKQAEGVIYTPQ